MRLALVEGTWSHVSIGSSEIWSVFVFYVLSVFFRFIVVIIGDGYVSSALVLLVLVRRFKKKALSLNSPFNFFTTFFFEIEKKL
jgi:hypothetical protein